MKNGRPESYDETYLDVGYAIPMSIPELETPSNVISKSMFPNEY
jgi:hypothetical protein